MSENSRKQSSRSGTGLQIFFIFDVAYCRNEADDPKDAIVYFNPSHISEAQKCNLCCQLMGSVQFFSSCFSPPKLLNMQKGKFAIKQEKNFVMALGGSKDMPDCVLLRQMKILQDLYRFYYKSLVSAQKTCESRKEFLEKMRNRWDCCLRMSQHGGNALDLTFSAVPTINLRHKNGKPVQQSTLDLLHSCQKKAGVIAGVIIYKNKVLATQFKPGFTYKLLLSQCAQREKFIPEEVKIKGRVPPGIQLLKAHLVSEEVEEVSLLNRYVTSSSNGKGLRNKCRQRQDLRILFADAPSSDELSTVTEESNEGPNSCYSFISTSDMNSESERATDDSTDNGMGYLNGSFHDEQSDEDSGQNERCGHANETLSDSALAVLRDVAKKSFISTNNKFQNDSIAIGDRSGSLKRVLKKGKSFPEGGQELNLDGYQVQILYSIHRRKNYRPKYSPARRKSTEEPAWETDSQCFPALSENKLFKIQRSQSEAAISMRHRLKNKDSSHSRPNADIMSEDSSYYSNEPSPTLGRKHWKNETDLSNSESGPQWQDEVDTVLKSFENVKNRPHESVKNDVQPSIEFPQKPPLRRKLSTILGPTESFKTSLKSCDQLNNSAGASQVCGITGNNISEKVSWSSSGYETTPSADTDKGFKSIAQELSSKENPQMLPNGKIVPVEMTLLTQTLKKELNNNKPPNLNFVENSDSQGSSVSGDNSESGSISSEEKRIFEDSTDSGNLFEKSQTKTKAFTLYVQSHSNIILLLLLNEKACHESVIHSLWRIGLSCLGDISVDVHKLMDNSENKEHRHNHRYLRFDTENHTLSGDSLPLNLKETSDKILGRVTQLMHEEFRSKTSISDLTIALRDTMIHGHSSEKKETYYQQSRGLDMPPQKLNHGTKPKRGLKRLENNFGSLLL